MADLVREILEKMVPPLRELQRNDIFSEAEIASIVDRREDFEYGLRKRQVDKSDFLRYIEYELNLEQLRKIRKRSAANQKPSFGDRSIVQHIHFIFQRATKRFQGDIPLWVQYLDFCESTKSTKQFSKTVSRALQLHPRAEGLWIRAASKQWELNRDMKTARRLMQQALRINRKSRKLFLEYFRLECLFIGHLAERREVLGLQQIGAEPTESSTETSIVTLPKAGKGKKATAAAPEVDAIVVATDAASKPDTDSDGNVVDARKGFFEGNVPLVVYTLAVQAMESKRKSSKQNTLPFEYHLQYVDIVNDIVAAGYAKSLRVLEENLWKRILLAFHHDATAHQTRARYLLRNANDKKKALAAALALFEEAVARQGGAENATASPKHTATECVRFAREMWGAYHQFVVDEMQKARETNATDLYCDWRKLLLQLFARAEYLPVRVSTEKEAASPNSSEGQEAGCAPDMYLLWVELLGEINAEKLRGAEASGGADGADAQRGTKRPKLGLTGKQRGVLERGLLRFPQNTPLWQLRLASAVQVHALRASEAAAAGPVGPKSGLARKKRKQAALAATRVYNAAVSAIGASNASIAPLRQQFLDFAVREAEIEIEATVAKLQNALSSSSSSSSSSRAQSAIDAKIRRVRRRRHRRVEKTFAEGLLVAHGDCIDEVAVQYLRWAFSVSALPQGHTRALSSSAAGAAAQPSSLDATTRPEGGASKRLRFDEETPDHSSASSSSSSDSDSDTGSDSDSDSDDGSANGEHMPMFVKACKTVLHTVSTRDELSKEAALGVYTTLLQLYAISRTSRRARNRKHEKATEARQQQFLRQVHEAAVKHLGDTPAGAAAWVKYLAHDSTQAATGAESMRTALYTRALDLLSGGNREWFVSAAAGI